MNEFKLEIDTNTKYMKIIRGIGKIGFGMLLGFTLFNLKYGHSVNWMAFLGGLNTLLLAFYPGKMANPNTLIINEFGIYTKGGTNQYQERSKMTWDDIRSLRVSENWFLTSRKIVITNSVGSTETISLPLYTKSQLEDLKLFLENSCSERQIKYTT